MRFFQPILTAILILAASLVVFALPAQASEQIEAVVMEYLKAQTAHFPGETSFTLGKIEGASRIAPCNTMEPFLPKGARLWGKATVGVRCLGPTPWTVYVPARVTVRGRYLVAARPLGTGHALEAGDLLEREGNLTALPQNVLTSTSQAIGKSLKNSVAEGQPLRHDLLVAPFVIRQGYKVRLVAKGEGFSISSEGRAMTNAAEGDPVRVQTPNGQIVNGRALSDGTVEVGY
ncbi:MAG: flagellar basal body P-ring formation protein FlgA [Betaproteobacteria bacterium]|nr:flagellar basal body P-ring formation protein FlgA [Betaproteobacteria bacterium]